MFVARRQHGRRKEHCKKREAVNRDGVASTVDSFPGCEQRGGGYAPDCSGLKVKPSVELNHTASEPTG